MFCGKCGASIGDQEKFCKMCGTPVSASQPAPAAPVSPKKEEPVKVTSGTGTACLVLGIISCILLLLLDIPFFAYGSLAFVAGPIALIFGADFEDIVVSGFIAMVGGFLLVGSATMSIVFTVISRKSTPGRSRSKCRKFRMAAAILILAASAITTLPVIWMNQELEASPFLYVILGTVMILAIVHMVLAIVTNVKDKRQA